MRDNIPTRDTLTERTTMTYVLQIQPLITTTTLFLFHISECLVYSQEYILRKYGCLLTHENMLFPQIVTPDVNLFGHLGKNCRPKYLPQWS